MSASSRKLSVVLLIVLLPAVGYLGWYNYRRMTNDGSEDTPLIPFQSDRSTERSPWRYAVEEDWLVDETTRDIAELLGFAKNPAGKLDFDTKPTPKKRAAYDLRAALDGIQVTTAFESKEYIWSPDDYSVWARELLSGWKIQQPASKEPTPSDYLAVLTDASPQTLIKEGQRLSAALTQAPLDASLHEQAALVTAAFALREAAGEFNDTRRELCRVAAHLAIVRALRPTADGPVRQIAEAALQTLAGREAAAMASLEKIPTDGPGAVAWVRALRLRNTGNWQLDADATVPLEMVEAFRARAHSVNSHFAILWAQKQKPSPLHDLRRLVVENGFGVEDGHGFVKESVGQEIVSLSADWKTFFGKDLQQMQAVKALSETAGRTVTQRPGEPAKIQVLGWDLWSAQHQRHFCESLRETDYFLRDLWGVPEYQGFDQFAKLNFASLPLFPLLERDLNEDPREISGITERVTALIKSHPEEVSPALWEDCLKPAESKMPPANVILPQTWFNPLVPTGTTYGFCQRCYGYPLPLSEDPFWTRLIDIAPSEYLLRYGKVWKTYGDRPPAGLAEKVYEPILAYNLKALKHLAKTQVNQSAKYPETMQRVCELDPDEYFELGKWYLDHHDEANAVEAYRKGVDLGEDRINASNLSGWLVNYLDDHGQAEKALAIASEAAEVYSYSGLETMAELKEKHGQFKEAEDYFRKIVERYPQDGSDELPGFYIRNQDKLPEFKTIATQLENRVFPDGLTKVTFTEFKEPPKDGAVLTSTSPASAAAGLRAGDVIVAIDGYRVRTESQYILARSLTRDPKMQLIVWNARGYREIAASSPNRRFSVGLANYSGARK